METAEPDAIKLLVRACDDLQAMDDTLDIGDLARLVAEQLADADGNAQTQLHINNQLRDKIASLTRELEELRADSSRESLYLERAQHAATRERHKIQVFNLRQDLHMAQATVKRLRFYEERYNGTTGTYWRELAAERKAAEKRGAA